MFDGNTIQLHVAGTGASPVGRDVQWHATMAPTYPGGLTYTGTGATSVRPSGNQPMDHTTRGVTSAQLNYPCAEILRDACWREVINVPRTTHAASNKLRTTGRGAGVTPPAARSALSCGY